jgi:hypothetical protein
MNNSHSIVYIPILELRFVRPDLPILRKEIDYDCARKPAFMGALSYPSNQK